MCEDSSSDFCGTDIDLVTDITEKSAGNPAWFRKEIVNCPTCKTNYQRLEFDREQIVCPRCINRKVLDDE